MLTLTRKQGEALILYTDTGHRILVRFDRITNKNQARLSIDAPREVTVLREELVGNRPLVQFEPLKDTVVDS